MFSRALRLFTVAPKVSSMLLHTNARLMSPVIVKMPSLSPTMTEGQIVDWNVEEGGTVEGGDVLCVIKTDKANMDFEVDEGGVLVKILAPKDTEIKVGAPIGLIATEDDDLEEVKNNLDKYLPK